MTSHLRMVSASVTPVAQGLMLPRSAALEGSAGLGAAAALNIAIHTSPARAEVIAGLQGFVLGRCPAESGATGGKHPTTFPHRAQSLTLRAINPPEVPPLTTGSRRAFPTPPGFPDSKGRSPMDLMCFVVRLAAE